MRLFGDKDDILLQMNCFAFRYAMKENIVSLCLILQFYVSHGADYYEGDDGDWLVSQL